MDELLTMELPTIISERLVAHAKDLVFKDLGDTLILKLLKSVDSRVRQTVALKSVIALPKTRVRRIMSMYTTLDEIYYYDVVHLLDLGISLARDRAVAAARRSFERQRNFLPD